MDNENQLIDDDGKIEIKQSISNDKIIKKKVKNNKKYASDEGEQHPEQLLEVIEQVKTKKNQ